LLGWHWIKKRVVVEEWSVSARERLAELVRLSGMSQTEVARRCGESPYWLNKRLQGKADIKADDLPRIARALRISPADFFTAGNPFAAPGETPEELSIEAAMRRTASDLEMRNRLLEESFDNIRRLFREHDESAG
jgi:transcriptional regulator with XRE-family HTH domain